MDATHVAVTQSGSNSTSTATVEDPLLVDAKKLYHNDPLFVALKDGKVAINDYIIVVAVILLTLAVLFGVNYQLVFVKPDLVYIIRSAIQAIIIFPILMFIYLHVPGEIADLFNSLHNNDVIGEPLDGRNGPDDYKQFVQQLTTNVSEWWWTAGAFAFVVVYCTYRVVYVYLNFANNPPIAFEIANTLNNVLIMYCITLSLARLLAAQVYSNVLFRTFKFHLNPLHPDGCAGIGQMENALWSSAGLLATMGFAALVMNASFFSLKFTPYSLGEAIAMGVIYLTLIPTLLVGWILVPHKVMVEGSNEILQPIANQFQTAIDTSVPTTSDDVDKIKRDNDRMTELKRRYDLLDQNFPLWPTQRLNRLIATMGLPALIAFLGTLPGIYNGFWPIIRQFLHMK